MNQFPPHLPPPTCDVEQRRQWQRLKIIGLSTFFGLLAGLTGALVAGALLLPTWNGETWIVARTPDNRPTLDDRIEKKLANTIYTVYSKQSSASGVTYLARRDRLADAVVGVSSGWLVSYLPQYDGRFVDWRVLGPQGTLYKVDRVLFDKSHGLAYLKVARLTPPSSYTQEQLKVVPFNSSLESVNTAFIYQNGAWVGAPVLGQQPAGADSHAEVSVPFQWTLSGSYRTGSIAVDAEGNVLGFLSSGSSIAPALTATRYLTGIEDRTSLTTLGLGIEGWFSSEQPLVRQGERLAGFLVAKTIGTTTLKKGDILLEINGRPFDFVGVWLAGSETSVRLKVLRAGQELNLEATRALH